MLEGCDTACGTRSQAHKHIIEGYVPDTCGHVTIIHVWSSPAVDGHHTKVHGLVVSPDGTDLGRHCAYVGHL